MAGGKMFLNKKQVAGRKKRGRPRKTNKFGTIQASTTNNVWNNRSILPNRFFTKLIYEAGNIGVTTSTVMGRYQFRVSSLFDPDFTSAGHKPRGFDEFSLLFTDYLVHGVKIDLTASIEGTATTGVIGMSYHDSSALNINNINDLYESRSAIHKVFDSSTPGRINQYLSIAKIMGISKTSLNAEKDYSAGIGANPVKSGYINCYYINIDENTATTWHIRARLTFFCEFKSPTDIGPS